MNRQSERRDHLFNHKTSFPGKIYYSCSLKGVHAFKKAMAWSYSSFAINTLTNMFLKSDCTVAKDSIDRSTRGKNMAESYKIYLSRLNPGSDWPWDHNRGSPGCFSQESNNNPEIIQYQHRYPDHNQPENNNR